MGGVVCQWSNQGFTATRTAALTISANPARALVARPGGRPNPIRNADLDASQYHPPEWCVREKPASRVEPRQAEA